MNKILVVDDEEDIRNSISEILYHRQYEVYQAQNGKEALLIIQKKKPDLIISDLMMPVMDGLKLLKIIKEDENMKKIPFIVLSAKVSSTNKEDCLSMGANEYLEKPFNAFDLYDAVARNINLSKNSELI